ncbi:MAG: hypothetical protein QOI13_1022 [Paraburkholderia sp.]|jgi:hypothetical protein|nr:hypothetical protein [Paraburkholderia sp.]
MPTTSDRSDEISIFIELSPDDGELDSFLRSHGLNARKSHGVFNAVPEIIQHALEHPAPYVWVTASAPVLIAALRAYAQTHKRRLLVRKSKAGITVDATNYTPKELKELEVFDVFEFEPTSNKTKEIKPHDT